MSHKVRVNSIWMSKPINIRVDTFGEQMSIGCSNVSMINWDHSTVGIGDQLSISFGFSLSIKMSITINTLKSKMVSSGGKVCMVNGSNSSIPMTNQLSISFSLSIEMTITLSS